jgi:hypothetical protein
MNGRPLMAAQRFSIPSPSGKAMTSMTATLPFQVLAFHSAGIDNGTGRFVRG